MYSNTDKSDFLKAVESLKRYRRADLIDEKGRSLLEDLYTDPLSHDYILNKCLLDNTTFLIGRKGTGKSTIFLRIEHEIRKKEGYISCYLDVKTIYESSKTDYLEIEYLNELLPKKLLEKYLIERAFIQSVLKEIQKEISVKSNDLLHNILKHIVKTDADIVKDRLEQLKQKIKDNNHLQQIEIPVIKSKYIVNHTNSEKTMESNAKLTPLEIEASPGPIPTFKIKNDSAISSTQKEIDTIALEKKFSEIFLTIFEIKDIISEIKEILRLLKINHLVILLDDFSEIDDDAIRTFVDVILAPLNNWSDDFIKFKIAAYPNRVVYGKIDPGKIDTINLDFFNLYSKIDRNQMEENAIDFTRRLVEKRINHYTKKNPDYYFDTTKTNIVEYYKLLFQVSMNVPRIIGYILSYSSQYSINSDRPINKSDIEKASQRYYEDNLYPFFENTTYSTLTIDEKIPILQLKVLLDQFVNKLIEIKSRIIGGDLRAEIYLKSQPYSSHFFFDPSLEKYIQTLELNFFISKYNEMISKKGKQVSIYCINFGLAKQNNLPWGKPDDTTYSRKYFIETPFDFNSIITEFLVKTKKIHCSNPECNQQFTVNDIDFLKFNHFKCNNCHSDVIIENLVSDDIVKQLEVDKNLLLPTEDLKIIFALSKKAVPVLAKEIAAEIDYSPQFIGKRCKRMIEELQLITRTGDHRPYKYHLSNLAIKTYINKNKS